MSLLAESMRSSIGSVDELQSYLAERRIVPAAAILEQLIEPAALAMRIPRSFADRIDWSDPGDPLLLQVLPIRSELAIAPSERADPIGDDSHSPTPGIVHRYPDRVLLLLTMTCALHCRYCFRREAIGRPERAPRKDALDSAFRYIEQHPQIWEVILSGGDPLILSDRAIGAALGRLRQIQHVKVIRIHTRVPVVFPGRVTDELVAAASAARPLYVVLHVNHPKELTGELAERVDRFVSGGVSVLSQSVLLRGINDSPEVLERLFRGLVEMQVKPYYLHQLDRARGTSHFRVPMREGARIVRALRGRVSGLCLPTYVLDLPGGFGKVPIPTGELTELTDDAYRALSFEGVELHVRE